MKKVLVPLAAGFAFALACGPTTSTDSRTGVTFKTDGGGSADGGPGSDGGPADGGQDPTDGGSPLTCGGILQCSNACGSDTSCPQDCYDNGSSAAQSLFQAALSCFEQQCPSTGTGVCSTNSAACDSCYSTAESGACASQVQACARDGQAPPTDGGPSAMTGCYQVIVCGNACQTQQCLQNCVAQADSNGQSLFSTLQSCIQQNCSSACQTQGATCNTCVQNVQMSGAACNAALVACQQDQ